MGGRRGGKHKERENPGCMSGVFQMFDFPISYQPCFKPNVVVVLPQEDPNAVFKGVKAPRNSLESEDMFMGTSSSSTTEIKEVDFDVPMEIRLPTKACLDELFPVESPGAKTPGLVARLMGLDLLPDNQPPSSPLVHCKRSKTVHRYRECEDVLQSGKPLQNRANHLKCEITSGSRSLPDTPRISSARRSDVDPSRLSLQINKENVIASEEFDKLRRKDWRFIDEETKSPSHYARQIVKQVKESVTRRVGLSDITNNTTRTKSTNVVVDTQTLKSKKPKQITKPSDESPSCSPRLRFLDTKPKPISTSQDTQLIISPRPTSKLGPITVLNNVVVQKVAQAKTNGQALSQHLSKKASCERFTQRRESKASDNNKCKKKSSTLANIETTSSSSSSAQIQIQVQSSRFQLQPCSRLPSVSSPTPYYEHHLQQLTVTLIDRENRYNRNGTEEFRYVTEILNRTGIKRDGFVSFTRWFSPSHPLDPIIFHLVEHSFQLGRVGWPSHRSNRKLMFQLVDEILADILRPYINIKPWFRISQNRIRKQMRSDQLLIQLWTEIQSFPATNCLVLADIDALIEKDLPEANVRTLPISDESESIVFELARDILDSLVHETCSTWQ
ncbi:hypothetical protein GIB67_019161 [Kingdonia uniflora]|uniref:DUF4378 domain-containing protein n=1 Tax=Kingdonia uniflora TaxID=39325 RepID=A0A7J7N069_9MAGN|nr:hypothetical protein GIB67_019161 [Kingdonia uniflora]